MKVKVYGRGKCVHCGFVGSVAELVRNHGSNCFVKTKPTMTFVPPQEDKLCFVACDQQKIDSGLCSCINRTMTETIEQAAERYYQEHIDQSNIPREHYEREIQDLMVCFADNWQSSQPNPHRIRMWHLRKLNDMVFLGEVNFSRMVEILNEIAAGKHKERIEI